MKSKLLGLGASVAALLGALSQATAESIPNYSLFTQVVVGNTEQSTFTPAPINNGLTIGDLSATATMNVSPSPNENIVASVGPSGGEASGTIMFQDFFEVVLTGVSSATQVPVIVTASGGVTQSHVSTGNTAVVQVTSPSVGNPPAGFRMLASGCD